MAYLLHSFFIRRLLCGLITTIALLWNSRIIMSFIVLISLGQRGSLLHLHSSQWEIYEGSTSAGQMESDALQVNIYTLLCEGGYLNLINCLVKVV